MKITPKSEKQIMEEGLLAKGVYSFEVVDAADKVSKAGNEMIQLNLRLFNDQAEPVGFVNDFLMDSLAYKVRHAADAMGLLEQYEAGALVASDFLQKTGEVKLVIQKDKSGQYPDRNSVADYVIKKTDDQPHPSMHSNTPMVDDTIPF